VTTLRIAVRVPTACSYISPDTWLGSANAIKYSDSGVKVLLSASNLGDREMKISVGDQNMGISLEDCNKVFEKDYRAHDDVPATRSGHGLSLYLGRQIGEVHHGKISVDSVLGKGTEFTIQFSVQAARVLEAGRV
jgi:signal transduction histidine kinase